MSTPNIRDRDYRNVTNISGPLHVDKPLKVDVALETDVTRLQWRQNQIDIGKNTIGYQRYTKNVPRASRESIMRTTKHPNTPPVNAVMSKRQWMGYYKVWRSQLHGWDDGDGFSSREELSKVKSDAKSIKLGAQVSMEQNDNEEEDAAMEEAMLASMQSFDENV